MEYPFTAQLIVEGYLQGVRIDTFLGRHFRNYTPFRMQRLVRAGQVRIEGVTASPEDRVQSGQAVDVRLTEPPDKLVEAENLPVEILHEDPWMIVVNKPAGQVVHPCGNHIVGTLMNALQFHFDRQTRLPGLLRPGVVHRLDRLTSGVTAVTKDHVAHRGLGIQFENGYVNKSYLALVHGDLEQERGSIDLPIGNIPGGESILMTTAANAIDARASRTSFEVRERFGSHTLVRAQPLTGRMHQIRVHLASIGHPVVADEFYGFDGPIQLAPRGVYRPPAVAGGSPPLFERHALHAHVLRLRHPITRQLMAFEAPLPADFERALDRLRRGSEVAIEASRPA